MNQIVSILLLLMCSNIDASGQANQFQDLGDKMFFNIFIHKPDTLVYDFIKKYFPAFTADFKPRGWTVYQDGTAPALYHTVHSFKFQNHPYFKAIFKEGRIDISASEESGGQAGVTDFQLWFLFDTRKDGEAAFDRLSTMFEKVSKQKEIKELHGRKIAHYTDQEKLTP